MNFSSFKKIAILLISLFIIYIYINTDFLKKDLIAKINMEEVEDSINSNYFLYKENANFGNIFFTSDTLIDNKENHNLKLMHSNNFWNPTTCSKMPTIYLEEINKIVFLSTEKNLSDDQFQSYAYMYDIKSNKLLRAPLGTNISSGIYKKGDNIIYFSIEKNINKINMYSINILKGEITESKNIKTFDNYFVKNNIDMNDLIYIGNDENSFPYMKISNINLKENLYIFDINKLTFNASKIINEINVLENKNGHSLYKVANRLDILAWQSLKKFDEIGLIIKDSGKVIWERKGDLANKYIITAI